MTVYKDRRVRERRGRESGARGRGVERETVERDEAEGDFFFFKVGNINHHTFRYCTVWNGANNSQIPNLCN